MKDKSIGRRLMDACKRSPLSTIEIARRSKVPKSTLYDMFKGGSITAERVCSIADVVAHDEDKPAPDSVETHRLAYWLLTGKESPKPADLDLLADTDAYVERILRRKGWSLTPERRGQLLSICYRATLQGGGLSAATLDPLIQAMAGK